MDAVREAVPGDRGRELARVAGIGARIAGDLPLPRQVGELREHLQQLQMPLAPFEVGDAEHDRRRAGRRRRDAQRRLDARAADLHARVAGAPAHLLRHEPAGGHAHGRHGQRSVRLRRPRGGQRVHELHDPVAAPGGGRHVAEEEAVEREHLRRFRWQVRELIAQARGRHGAQLAGAGRRVCGDPRIEEMAAGPRVLGRGRDQDDAHEGLRKSSAASAA